MSENLNLVRSIFAAWEVGDLSSVDWVHPEMEYVWVHGPAPGSWTGVAGMRESFVGDFLNVWENFSVRADEYRELDGERVFVLVRWSGRGKASGLELFGEARSKGAFVFHVRDGKVTELVSYFDRNRALADLGLNLSREGAAADPDRDALH
jgi:ketosteroid isomerase-like protein